jgi:hypothetical protein
MPLGAELGATLTTAGSQNCTACTGLHAGAEAVGLGPAAVVRLKSALGHFDLLKLTGICPRQPEQFTLSGRPSQGEIWSKNP